jgi:hypothetical protein
MNNNTRTVQQADKRVARPPKILIPLIKADLRKLHEIELDTERTMLMPIRISIGEKLIELKPQVNHGNFEKTIRKHFPSLVNVAGEWMRMARHEKASAETISSVADYRRATQRGYGRTGTAKWREPVQDVLNRLEVESFNLQQHELSQAKEAALERKLGLELIDIGYKVLATKLHPDRGGSHEAMQRLNTVRARLREAA